MHQGRTWNDPSAGMLRMVTGASTADIGTLVLSCVLVLLVAASPVSVLMEGRNLETINYLNEVEADGIGAWFLRLSTLAIVAGCLLVIALALGSRRSTGRTAHVVFGGYLVFFLTNSVTNALFGTVPDLSARAAYPLLVLWAIYLQREEHEQLFDVVKWTMAAIMLGSLVLAPLLPELTVRSYAPELRLPFVPFRFWGLGNSPNSTGPLALALMLMCIHRPFERLVLQMLVIAGALTTLVLTQSQTAWAIAVVILPLFLLFRWRVGEGAIARDAGGYVWVVAAFACVAAVSGYLLASVSAGIDNMAMTGRGRIWRTAVDLYAANPMFGYGPTAWDTAFRIKVGMPFAFTAHNQVLQSMSTAGLVGLIGWLTYLATLVLAAARLARPTRGLAPALLLAFSFMRSFSEASFDFRVVTADEFMIHVVMFVLITGAWQNELSIRRTPRHPAYAVE